MQPGESRERLQSNKARLCRYTGRQEGGSNRKVSMRRRRREEKRREEKRREQKGREEKRRGEERMVGNDRRAGG